VKFLTLHQPWATLIAIGAKRIETRGWRTSYRGELGIHAGLTAFFDDDYRDPSVRRLQEAGYLHRSEVPRGAVVAICRLVECIPTEQAIARGLVQGDERKFGDYYEGRWAWLLEDVHQVVPVIEARGRRLLWDDEQLAALCRRRAGLSS